MITDVKFKQARLKASRIGIGKDIFNYTRLGNSQWELDVFASIG